MGLWQGFHSDLMQRLKLLQTSKREEFSTKSALEEMLKGLLLSKHNSWACAYFPGSFAIRYGHVNKFRSMNVTEVIYTISMSGLSKAPHSSPHYFSFCVNQLDGGSGEDSEGLGAFRAKKWKVFCSPKEWFQTVTLPLTTTNVYWTAPRAKKITLYWVKCTEIFKLL